MQLDREQASEEEGQDGIVEMESLGLGLNPAAQKIIQQLLLRGKKSNENRKSKGKSRTGTADFQDSAGARKRAKKNVNSDQKSDDGLSATPSTSTLEKTLTSRRNTGNRGNEVKKWTHDKIVRLIDLYEERACLWDVFDKEYHDKDKRERALVEIANELDNPVADIKSTLGCLIQGGDAY